jgi:hypothetical protein
MAWAQDEAQDEGQGTIKIAGGELTISGAAKMGVSVDGTTKKNPNSKSDVGRSAGIYFYSDDIGYDGIRGSAADAVGARFDLSFSYIRGPIGTKLTFRSDNLESPGLLNAYGFVNLFGGIVNVTGGMIDDAIWGSTMFSSTETDTSLTSVTGIRIAIAPFAGFSIGAAWDLTKINNYNTDTPVGKELVAGPAFDSKYGTSITPGGFFGNTRFGVIYTNDAFGGASVELKLNGSKYNPTEDKNLGLGADLLWALKVTAVQNLALTFDGYFDNIFVSADYAKDYGIAPSNRWLASFRGDYKIGDPLTVGLKVRLWGEGTNKGESSIADSENYLNFDARIFGYYDITQVFNLGAEIGLGINGAPKDTADGWNNDESTFKDIWIKPKATFTLSEGLTFVVYDKIDIMMANFWKNTYTDGATPPEKAGYLNNKFQLDFVWTF